MEKYEGCYEIMQSNPYLDMSDGIFWIFLVGCILIKSKNIFFYNPKYHKRREGELRLERERESIFNWDVFALAAIK